jgi:hypothetical protein
MRQSSNKLDDIIAPFNERPLSKPAPTDEETAIAALTALRNNNINLHYHHQFQQNLLTNSNSTNNLINNLNTNNCSEKSDNNYETSSSTVSNTIASNTNKSVTSLISKIHLQNLEANSVSVIPLDTKSSASSSLNSPVRVNSSSPVATAASTPQISVKNLTQLQQRLETAAVLMDMGKKVIISPPSSNPQSPKVNEQNNNHQSITSSHSSVIKVRIFLNNKFFHNYNLEINNLNYENWYNIILVLVDQGWPTQIGLWAAFGKISKNIDFLGQILTKTVEKHSKYRKISEF